MSFIYSKREKAAISPPPIVLNSTLKILILRHGYTLLNPLSYLIINCDTIPTETMLDVITGITLIIYSGNFMCLQFKKIKIGQSRFFCSLYFKDINRFVDLLKLMLENIEIYIFD